MTKSLQNHVSDFVKNLRQTRSLSPNTVDAYRRDLSDLLDYLGSDFVINDINKIEIRKYLAHLKEKGLKSSSIGRRLAALRTFFRFMIQQDVVEKNPARAVMTPKKERALPKFLSEAQMNKLLNGIFPETELGLRDRAILEILYSTGARISEIVGLDVQDVDFDSSLVRVMGKGSKERIIPLGGPAKTAILNWMNVRSKKSKAREHSLFVNGRDGKRLTSRGMRMIVGKYLRKVIKGATPHSFRHTFATHLLDRGAELRAVQELLGHSSLNTTQIYTHVSVKKLKELHTKAHPRS
ncbi:MAG: tyrosine recombinase XerC [Candidatus Lindowbacteria bacterium]|nr:tyrosine recombinase XerC [Candidatus Lindowbacteria bacterium]